MERIINYRDIPTDKKTDVLNALEQIGFFPAYGGVKTMQRVMEKSVPGSGPQFYFVFREDKLIGYNFLIGDTKRYKAFPWLAISNIDTKMRNVGGIAQTEAQKSSDLFMKCRYLDEITGGRGTVFATGTPISNSMVELYTIQRYLQYNTLVKNGLQHFDAWASTFGETITAVELTPEGYTLVGR